ncbi:MAG: glycoside hydrolase family 3 protein [Streptosporangiales bacterium]
MSAGLSTDPALARLADAVLIPPFPGHRAPGWVLAALERGLAGVTLFGSNIEGPEQLAALTAQLHGAGPQPLVALDEEGGDVTRIAHLTGSPYPGNAALGAVDDVALTAAVHQALGQDLAALGVTVDLAPSVDVNTAADNPVIGIRSFGSDPGLVARHAAAAVSGLQAGGVAACAKHFPGHGSTSADTHRELVTVDASLDLLRRRDLPPFVAAIAAGVRGVMPGHLRVPDLTGDLPATLSSAALTGLLRGELGFTGVIISDALEMRAVRDAYGIPEAAVLAMAAGTDLLCLGRDLSEDGYLAVRRALSEAVSSGRLPARRLEEAARNVAQLRAWLATAAPPGTAVRGTPARGTAARDGALPAGGGGENAHIGLVAARRAIRASDVPGPLTDPVVVELDGAENIAVGAVPWGLGAWVAPGSVRRVPAGLAGGDPARIIAEVLAQAAGRSLIVVVRDAHRHPAAQAVITGLVAARPDTVLVDMGLPLWRPPGGVHVATYGAARPNAQAAAEVLGLAP